MLLCSCMWKKLNGQNIKINRLTIKFQGREHVRDWEQQILIKILDALRRPSGKQKRGGDFSIGPKINHGRQYQRGVLWVFTCKRQFLFV